MINSPIPLERHDILIASTPVTAWDIVYRAPTKCIEIHFVGVHHWLCYLCYQGILIKNGTIYE